ncbi:DUF3783 domain-containing protein [Spirochaeta isovalerica]|uniref:Uncharacterized protein n=1 Tax=Spirochaeta isovalerica TaxID=150 RepID=A0A841RH49_9SPIO|nr:DUF3783 domain-containing protein [Spirochaeta isovalerica]MBB6482109.1 hypothetical protein [Spirochaeta isovalerica]
MAFRKIEDQGTLPGPRALFICGYTEEEHRSMSSYLSGSSINNIEVIPCRLDALEKKVGDVLSGSAQGEIIDAEKLPPVMVWAGIGHDELDKALSGFQSTKLKRPIFATATIPNMDFTVKELLNHLLSEQKSMREAMNQNE